MLVIRPSALPAANNQKLPSGPFVELGPANSGNFKPIYRASLEASGTVILQAVEALPETVTAAANLYAKWTKHGIPNYPENPGMQKTNAVQLAATGQSDRLIFPKDGFRFLKALSVGCDGTAFSASQLYNEPK